MIGICGMMTNAGDYLPVDSSHKVSAKYMPLYIAEFQFRYNNRMNPDMFGTAIAGY
jgi:hypothetical protein